MQWEEKADFVRCCRVGKDYREDQRRLTISLGERAAPLRQPLLNALKECGWDQKFGRAPPGNMEREVQEWLGLLIS